MKCYFFRKTYNPSENTEEQLSEDTMNLLLQSSLHPTILLKPGVAANVSSSKEGWHCCHQFSLENGLFVMMDNYAHSEVNTTAVFNEGEKLYVNSLLLWGLQTSPFLTDNFCCFWNYALPFTYC